MNKIIQKFFYSKDNLTDSKKKIELVKFLFPVIAVFIFLFITTIIAETWAFDLASIIANLIVIIGGTIVTFAIVCNEHAKRNKYNSQIKNSFIKKEPNSVPPKKENYEAKNPILDEFDYYLIDVGRFLVEKNNASIGIIQRNFNIGFNRAQRIMNKLEEIGVVGEEVGTKPRKILTTRYGFEKIIEGYGTPKRSSNNESQDFSHDQFDSMEGHDFEYFCADTLRKNGFINVEVTQGSGDHGIDVLAEKDDITYAIQCKCYSDNVGNSAVQQAHTGKSLYHKDIAVVMTNRYFTAQAIEEAKALGVKLWDRDKLNEMIETKG